MAETKAAAELAFDAFIESYTPKYEKAADCLSKDRETLLAFYDFRPSTGNTCGRPIPLKAPSLPCATARSDRRDACPTGRRSRWSSSCLRPRRKAGVVSMATTSCQKLVLRCDIQQRDRGHRQAG